METKKGLVIYYPGKGPANQSLPNGLTQSVAQVDKVHQNGMLDLTLILPEGKKESRIGVVHRDSRRNKDHEYWQIEEEDKVLENPSSISREDTIATMKNSSETEGDPHIGL